jgi:hypothetical protein
MQQNKNKPLPRLLAKVRQIDQDLLSTALLTWTVLAMGMAILNLLFNV